MAFENNIPKIKNNFGVDGMRDISARRAATISNMIEEAAKQGIDDSFARTAIGRYGADNAKAMRASMKDPDDFTEFANEFGTDHNREIYEMEVVEKTEDKLSIDFHYCPLVKAWQKQGCTDEEIERLCDMAMCGDRGIASAYGARLELPKTIARGDDICEIRFKKGLEKEGEPS